MQPSKVYTRLLLHQRKINLLRGGTRSGKTTALIQMFAGWLKTGYFGFNHIPKGQAYIVRQTFPVLRMTVLKEFKDILDQAGIRTQVKHRITVNEFSYAGRVIQFLSADNPEKLKGLDPTLAWLNEPNDMSMETFNQILMRLRGMMFLDYNPSDPDGWIKTELEDKWLKKRKDMYLDISVYKDNPFLPQSMIDEIEGFETLDPALYNVYSKGNWMELKGQIFPVWDTDYSPPDGCKLVVGIDFGFNDPSAIIEVKYDKHNLWIKQICYERRLTTPDLIELARDFRGVRIIADSAEPDRIKEFKNAGFKKIKKANKGGPTSNRLVTGINIIKQHHIHIHPESIDILKEIKRYRWSQDDKGKDTDKPIDAFNHAMDAIRYAITYAKLKKGGIRIVGVPEMY